MNNLKTEFCGVTFSNPFILPSGFIGETPENERAIKAGVGGLTFKSLTALPRQGNPLPRVWRYDHGFLNSVGLRNPGIEKGLKEIVAFGKKHPQPPQIVSLFATKISEFVELVEKAAEIKPDLIELNLSCPNVEDEFGASLGMAPDPALKIVKASKKIAGKVPVICKLSPNVVAIAEIAKACESGGADAISAINTVGPGMLIDIKKRTPILGAKKGGVSGPGIFPVALRCVYEIYEAVKIPILGMGGITTVNDCVAMLMAGATLLGVGTATYLKGMGVYAELAQGLADYLKTEKITNVSDLTGLAHQK